ncbi:unnamed protein product [Scytosiphon promiscuus]
MLFVRRSGSSAVQLSSRWIACSTNVRHVQACTPALAPSPAAARENAVGAIATPRTRRQGQLDHDHDHYGQRREDGNMKRNTTSKNRAIAVNLRRHLTSRTRHHLSRPSLTTLSASKWALQSGGNAVELLGCASVSSPAGTGGNGIRRSCSTRTSTNAAEPEPEPEPSAEAAFPMVSRVDPAAAEKESAIAQMAESGEWEEASKALQAIRDEGMKPSMAVHMSVISVCRRALQWDLSSKVYSEMIDAHLGDSESFFERMACDDFEDQSNHVFARACGIVVHMMRSNGVQPNNGTYRALLQYCKDEGSWEAAILLLEHSKRTQTGLNLFSFDLLIATVAEQGFREVSTMLYELGVVEAKKTVAKQQQQTLLEREGSGGSVAGAVEWPGWPLRVFAKGALVLELHDLTLSTALATVQVALLDVVRRPTGRVHWSGGVQCLRIITGMGNNSKDNEAVIKPAVVEALESMGLRPEFQQHNEGCIELRSENLMAYAHRVKTQGAAAAAWS